MSQTVYAQRRAEPLSPRITGNDYATGSGQGHVTATYPAHHDEFSSNDDIHMALSFITTGINTGQSPVQLKHVIDTAQAHLGNQALMHYVGQHYREQVHGIAQDGFRDTPQTFPFQDEIQQAFGEHHDISGLKAYTGTAAQAANAKLGSRAFHKGGQVAFAGQPSLKEAAHEAAHYVQNVRGDELERGIGGANDRYEQHADAVAEAVVRREPTESLLNQLAEGPKQVNTVPTTADSPIQMMWPALARQGLSPAKRTSMLRSGGTSLMRPDMFRNLFLSPKRYDWNKDILFGPDNNDTLDLAIKQEAATDSAIHIRRFDNFNKQPPPGFSAGHLWDKGAFNFADRSQLKRRDRPYMDYAREAIATAMSRGGNIYWALGRLNFDKVFSDLFRTQKEYGTDPVEYMAKVSFPELMDKHGKFVDANTGEEVKIPEIDLNTVTREDIEEKDKFSERVEKGEIKEVTPFQPLITTTEIIGFLMGDERKYLDKTTFFDARHCQADQAYFLSAFYDVLTQLRARQPELGQENDYKLEQSVYRSLDKYTGFPCSHCGEIFRAFWELEKHWKDFPRHNS